MTGLFSAAAAGILLPKRPNRQARAMATDAPPDTTAAHAAVAAAAPPVRETVSYADL